MADRIVDVVVQGVALFGAFSDCAPDRWGRRLIDRAEERRAEREGGAERSRGEIDYLLGVRDDLRQGAPRFRFPAARRRPFALGALGGLHEDLDRAALGAEVGVDPLLVDDHALEVLPDPLVA